jgi:peroxiredoxin
LISGIVAFAVAFAVSAQAQQAARPWIGIAIERGEHGVRITKAIEDTPAARAGLGAGDEVVGLDGNAVSDPTELISRIQSRGVGETLTLAVLRDGKERKVSLALVARPDEMALLRNHLVGKKAPPFALGSAVGPHPAKLDALAGDVVVLEFWATWCVPCNTTMPRLSAWQEKYGARGLRVVGLSTESLDIISTHLAKRPAPLKYTVASDPEGAVYEAYAVPAVPTFVVIDRKGRVRHVDVGAGSIVDGVEAAFRPLLDEK